jgi:hypothetical protein
MVNAKSCRPMALVLVGLLLLPQTGFSCAWDYDTIKMERRRFPSTLELITGKFLRHSPEFYQWRIEDRLRRLQREPKNVALLDDLAVAYDKTGQHDKAIATAMQTEAIQPGRYETAANLGTFYIHAGRPAEGLPHIDRALAINADAHFGREKYQKHLVEYIVARHALRGKQLPIASDHPDPEVGPPARIELHRWEQSPFDRYLQFNKATYLSHEERAKAIKGILGMMRFGTHDAPLLLEALAQLLANDGSHRDTDAKLLAARAYLKASYASPDAKAKKAYRAMAEHCLVMQTGSPMTLQGISLAGVEAEFQKELKDAEAWYKELRERELAWIRDGKNPEAEFDRLYDTEPTLSGAGRFDTILTDSADAAWQVFVIALLLSPLVAIAAVLRWLYRLYRRARAQVQT